MTESFYNENRESWNASAKVYEERFMFLNIYNDSYNRFCSYLPPHAHVFEIGCGPGNIPKYILQQRPDLNWEAIDNAAEMILIAQHHNPKALFKVMDVMAISGIQQQYNAIVCGFCLPYIAPDDALKTITECNRILLPDGWMYLSFIAGDQTLSGYQTGSNGKRMYFHFYPLTLVVQMLEQNNFRLIESIEVPYDETDIHTILIAQKK